MPALLPDSPLLSHHYAELISLIFINKEFLFNRDVYDYTTASKCKRDIGEHRRSEGRHNR